MEKSLKEILFKCFDSVVNFALFVVLFLALVFCLFSLWENKQIESESKSVRYEQYKPPKGNNLPYSKLKQMNPDVVSWIEVYGTGIDYPVAYTAGSNSYINKDIFGKHSVSGSIFIDFQNNPDLTDFVTIIHGHHMVNHSMFGDLDQFCDLKYFETHPYGKILCDDNNYKRLSFFAFLEVSAYDPVIYNHHFDDDKKEVLLNYIKEKAIHQRAIDVSSADHLVILSTCSQDETSGRYVLVGKLTDDVAENTFVNDRGTGWVVANDGRLIHVVPILALIVLVIIISIERSRKNVKK